MRVSSQPLDELDIPAVMKVASVQSFAADKLLVPSGIVVVCGVERLMQVADEVQ